MHNAARPGETARMMQLSWTESGPDGRPLEITAHKKVTPKQALLIAQFSADLRENGGRVYYDLLTNHGIPDHNPRDAEGRVTAAAYTAVDAATRMPREQRFSEDGRLVDPARGAPAIRHFDAAGQMTAATSYPTWEFYTRLYGDDIARFTRTGSYLNPGASHLHVGTPKPR